MRRRFFVDKIRNGQAEISGQDARHLSRVLRVEPGQRYEISDNHSVYLAEVEKAHKEQVVFRTLEKLELAPPPVHIILCAALIKFDRFEWIVEKATELGVGEIIPVETGRTERGLERGAQKRVERWRRIALEASEQARRAHLPEIYSPVSFETALLTPAVCRYALDESPGGIALARTPFSGASLALLIGPEGGWTDGERAAFVASGWTRVSLGRLILRAETAAIAALAVVSAMVAAKPTVTLAD